MAMGGPEPGEHVYRDCTDEYCPVEWCQIYKQGRRDGHEAGYDAGHQAGEAEGYAAGYSAGEAERPR